MFRVYSPYPLFAVVLVLIVAVLLKPQSLVKAAEPNGGQRVVCGVRGVFDSSQDFIERFLRDNPERRIAVIHGNCIVHEPVR